VVELLLRMPGPLAEVLVIAIAVALSLAGLAVVRRRVDVEALRGGNEVAGVVYAIVGGMYAVLLAFVVVAVWEDFGHAEGHVETEVTGLGTLYRDAAVFPEPSRTEMRAALREYTASVVDDEWPTMARGEPSPKTLAAYDRLWAACYRVDPGDGPRAAFFEQAVDRMGQVGESRRARVLASRSQVPSTLWVLLLAGGALIVAMTFVFGTEHATVHRVSVAALAAVVASVLFVTLALDRPFGAGITLSRHPYRELLAQWAVTP
jgi:hypothetical protein